MGFFEDLASAGGTAARAEPLGDDAGLAAGFGAGWDADFADGRAGADDFGAAAFAAGLFGRVACDDFTELLATGLLGDLLAGRLRPDLSAARADLDADGARFCEGFGRLSAEPFFRLDALILRLPTNWIFEPALRSTPSLTVIV